MKKELKPANQAQQIARHRVYLKRNLRAKGITSIRKNISRKGLEQLFKAVCPKKKVLSPKDFKFCKPDGLSVKCMNNSVKK